MNKMNLPPPFGPLRKRPEMPSATSVKVPRKDEVKYYGESQIKGNQEEEEEDDAEYEVKRPNTETTPVFVPFTKTEVPAPSQSTATAETPGAQHCEDYVCGKGGHQEHVHRPSRCAHMPIAAGHSEAPNQQGGDDAAEGLRELQLRRAQHEALSPQHGEGCDCRRHPEAVWMLLR